MNKYQTKDAKHKKTDNANHDVLVTNLFHKYHQLFIKQFAFQADEDIKDDLIDDATNVPKTENTSSPNIKKRKARKD